MTSAPLDCYGVSIARRAEARLLDDPAHPAVRFPAVDPLSSSSAAPCILDSAVRALGARHLAAVSNG